MALTGIQEALAGAGTQHIRLNRFEKEKSQLVPGQCQRPAGFMYIGALAFWQNADYTKGEKLKRTCGEEAA